MLETSLFSNEILNHCPLCSSKNLALWCSENHFAKCTDCSLIFDNPRPSLDNIIRFYSKPSQYDEWLEGIQGRDALWKRRLKLVRKHVKKGALLDVGAGIGQFLHHASKFFEVHGTEVSSTALEIAKEKYGITLTQTTIEDYATTKRFDALTMFHVLEHVPDPGFALDKAIQLLNSGGYLFIAVPNEIDSILTRRNRWMRRQGFAKYQPLGNVGIPPIKESASELHLTHFTWQVLVAALKKRGLNVVENGLDPSFSVTGMRKFRRYLRFYRYQAIQSLTGMNLYDAIWVVARKPS